MPARPDVRNLQCPPAAVHAPRRRRGAIPLRPRRSQPCKPDGGPGVGGITGLIDWEMAGFPPAWLCATSGTWFDDDSCRFVVEDHQDGPDGYGEDTEMDTVLRQTFLPSRKRVTQHCWTTTAREWNCRRCFTICAMSTRRIRCYGLRNIRSTIGM